MGSRLTGKSGGSADLNEVISKMKDIARSIDEIAYHEYGLTSPRHLSDTALAAIARRELKSRRKRTKELPNHFGEPAWEMMLELFVSFSESTEFAITSLCVASGATPTTALRRIGWLVDDGILLREDDPNDGRRTYVSLSMPAVEMMRRWLSEGVPVKIS